MAEHSEQLQITLGELQHQLASTREITPELRKSLAGLAAEIERILAEGSSTETASTATYSGQRETLINRLTDTARQFEGTHPTLAGTIGSIIDALGQMGV